ncbi:septum formation family protein [Dactylosporangium sp. NPDC051541]|uniref:septum formation family protein n=1 Tax=Dactylosporangium sp. NPDC051541 TaxID=3363977 RepID=UPI0037A2B004
MKRIALLACAVALVAAAAGCGSAKAGDGDLTDDWGMLAAAKVPEPAAGACWTTTRSNRHDMTSSRAFTQPCETDHVFETVSVGHFTGDAASGSSAPTGEKLTAAWTECDKAIADFLGGEWQSGRLWANVVPPTDRQWTGGARFYRCDVAALQTEDGDFQERKTTLKGSLAGAGELRLTCGTQVRDSAGKWQDVTPAKCEDAHDIEYVGTVSSPGGEYPATSALLTSTYSKTCEAKVLAYTGMSRGGWANQKNLGFGYWLSTDKVQWVYGNHSARCYALIHDKKINRSLKGAGDVTV